MIALPDPLLQAKERSGASLEQPRATSNKFPSILVREKVRRNHRVNPKAEMHHALRWDNHALRWGDVIPQTHCSVQKCVYKLTSPRHMNKTPGRHSAPAVRTQNTICAHSQDQGHNPRPKQGPRTQTAPKAWNQGTIQAPKPGTRTHNRAT